MSKTIRNGKIYNGGMAIEHCLYLQSGFVFDHEKNHQYKKLIRNGKTVKV